MGFFFFASLLSGRSEFSGGLARRGGTIGARSHGHHDVFAFLAVVFGYTQQELVLVQAELGGLADGKQDWMLVVLRPDAEDQAIGLKNIFLAEYFLCFLMLAVRAEEFAGYGLAALFGKPA